MMWNQLNQHSSSSICDDASPKSTYERHTPIWTSIYYRRGRLVWSEHGLFKNVMYFCGSVIFCLFLLGFSLLRFSKQQFKQWWKVNGISSPTPTGRHKTAGYSTRMSTTSSTIPLCCEASFKAPWLRKLGYGLSISWLVKSSKYLFGNYRGGKAHLVFLIKLLSCCYMSVWVPNFKLTWPW